MILRSWHGLVDRKVGDAFERYFTRAVVSELPRLHGNLGVFTRRVTQGGSDHFFLLSYWENWDAIHRFAGDAPHLAVGYPDDQRFGLVADPIVLHTACTEIRPWFGEPTKPEREGTCPSPASTPKASTSPRPIPTSPSRPEPE